MLRKEKSLTRLYPLSKLIQHPSRDGDEGKPTIARQIVTNLRYANDIILLATSEAELQELVDRLDRVSRKYSLVINVDKTKLMVLHTRSQ